MSSKVGSALETIGTAASKATHVVSGISKTISDFATFLEPFQPEFAAVAEIATLVGDISNTAGNVLDGGGLKAVGQGLKDLAKDELRNLIPGAGMMAAGSDLAKRGSGLLKSIVDNTTQLKKIQLSPSDIQLK